MNDDFFCDHNVLIWQNWNLTSLMMVEVASMWRFSNLSPLLRIFLSFDVLRFFLGIRHAFQTRIVRSQLPETYWKTDNIRKYMYVAGKVIPVFHFFTVSENLIRKELTSLSNYAAILFRLGLKLSVIVVLEGGVFAFILYGLTFTWFLSGTCIIVLTASVWPKFVWTSRYWSGSYTLQKNPK